MGMTAPDTSPARFFANIQLLRAVAALFVVLLHAQGAVEIYSAAPERSWFGAFKSGGWFGVDLFFVISGFVIVHVGANLAGKPGASVYFLMRRIIRVVPLYWMVTSAVVVLLLVMPGLFNWLTFDAWHVISSYLFIPARNPMGLVQPLIPVGWTLSYEMYFYAIFALLLCLPRKYLLPCITTFFCMSVAAGTFVEDGSVAGDFLTNVIFLEFVMGCWIGQLVHQQKFVGKWAALCLATAAALWIMVAMHVASPEHNRILLWGIAGAMLVYAMIALETSGTYVAPWWAIALGNSSYALYLTHYFVLAPLGKLWAWLALDASLGPNMLVIIGVILSIGVAHAIHLLFEVPVTRFLKSRLHLQGV